MKKRFEARLESGEGNVLARMETEAKLEGKVYETLSEAKRKDMEENTWMYMMAGAVGDWCQERDHYIAITELGNGNTYTLPVRYVYNQVVSAGRINELDAMGYVKHE